MKRFRIVNRLTTGKAEGKATRAEGLLITENPAAEGGLLDVPRCGRNPQVLQLPPKGCRPSGNHRRVDEKGVAPVGMGGTLEHRGERDSRDIVERHLEGCGRFDPSLDSLREIAELSTAHRSHQLAHSIIGGEEVVIARGVVVPGLC